jgi:diketogulonate reductase-like aldo/keto reductase
MQTHTFGPTRRAVPVIGQGTWHIEQGDRRDAVSALRRGMEVGMTHIDTAEMYGSGEAEEVVAEAVAGKRDSVFIVSKVLPSNASRRGTITACERSLRRLKTDRLDCYLLHWPGNHPLADTIAAFEQLKAEGKILSWGVSNFDESDLDEALTIAGPGKIACNQVLYHLAERSIEHAVIPWCEKHDVSVVGYSPFGSGNFPKAASPAGKVLEEIGKLHNATARAVALQFLTRAPSLLSIPKAASPAHVADNARAGEFRLSADEVAQIDKAFPRGRKRGLAMI